VATAIVKRRFSLKTSTENPAIKACQFPGDIVSLREDKGLSF